MFAALLTVAYVVLMVNSLIPFWQARTVLSKRLEAVEAVQAQRQNSQQAASESIQQQIDQARDALSANTSVFLTEAEAASVLDALNQYAEITGVDLVELQALPLLPKVPNALFDSRQFQVEVVGEMPGLLKFGALMHETAVSTVSLSNLTLSELNGRGNLSFVIIIYTSPIATGDALNNLPATTVLDADTVGSDETTPETQTTVLQSSAADQLAQQLDVLWAAENWPVVLSIIDRILEEEPNFPNIREKQYGALVNFGYQLIEAENFEEARRQLETAVVLNPLSGEAQAGLTILNDLISPTDLTNYIVQNGDTLFAIAQQFGVTVDDLRLANDLVDNTLSVGQELIIP